MEEVWLLWQQEPWYEPELVDIYSTEELADKHRKELEDEEREIKLNKWRERWNKKPTDFPDEDLTPDYEFFTQCWTVSTE